MWNGIDARAKKEHANSSNEEMIKEYISRRICNDPEVGGISMSEEFRLGGMAHVMADRGIDMKEIDRRARDAILEAIKIRDKAIEARDAAKAHNQS